MTYWIFSSNSLENIKIGYENLTWGFWDRDAGKKMRKNWRNFIRKFNQIKPFDITVLQLAKTGDIHAIGVIKETYYDDQTSIWENEHKQGNVLYPWRVKFSIMLYSEDSVIKKFVKIHDYVDGYGIGELESHEFRMILEAFRKKFGNINI